MALTFIQKVAKIQKELKAPKNQRNKFGNYNYRNQEDILEAVKPLLGDLVLTINDEMVEVGGRIYVRATATIRDGEGSRLDNVAYAREAQEQKGMAEAQLTGATSSYARKYALNGLFLIDDTKDQDTDEFTAKTRGVEAKSTPEKEKQQSLTNVKEKTEVVTPEVEMTVANPENNVNTVPKAKGGWGNKAKQNQQKQAGDLY